MRWLLEGYVTVNEDSYEQGEGAEISSGDFTCVREADTPEEAIKLQFEEQGYNYVHELALIEEDGTVSYSVQVNSDNEELRGSDMEEFKADRLKAFCRNYIIRVSLITYYKVV